MDRAIRIVAGISGVVFLLQGVRWAVRPANAAEDLGMPLLEGLGRSTQVGDSAAFFLSLGTMILVGIFRREGTWLRAAALMLGLAAAMRTLAWGVHGADFALPFILIEALFCALLLFAASRPGVVGEAAA
jgi:hypothetical protein